MIARAVITLRISIDPDRVYDRVRDLASAICPHVGLSITESSTMISFTLTGEKVYLDSVIETLTMEPNVLSIDASVTDSSVSIA